MYYPELPNEARISCEEIFFSFTLYQILVGLAKQGFLQGRRRDLVFDTVLIVIIVFVVFKKLYDSF